MSRYAVHMAQMWRIKTIITGPVGGDAFSQLLFSKLPGLDPADAQERVGAFWNSYRAYMSTDYTALVQSDADVVDVDTGNLIEVSDLPSTLSYAGTDEGDRLPPQTQGLARMGTGVYVAGRQLRGRMFLPGVTESNSTNGAPGSGYLDAVGDALNALVDTSLTVFPLIYSRTHHVAAPIATNSVWTKWASLRSRRD